MTTTALTTELPDSAENTFDRACQLIESELNGRRITAAPAHLPQRPEQIRQHKAALITR